MYVLFGGRFDLGLPMDGRGLGGHGHAGQLVVLATEQLDDATPLEGADDVLFEAGDHRSLDHAIVVRLVAQLAEGLELKGVQQHGGQILRHVLVPFLCKRTIALRHIQKLTRLWRGSTEERNNFWISGIIFG